MAGSYFAFLVSGAVLGAVAGAVAWSTLIAIPEVQTLVDQAPKDLQFLDARLGAGAGAALGGIIGLLLRGMTGTGVRREKLTRVVRDKVGQLLSHGGKSEVGTAFLSARDQLRDGMAQCRTTFAENVRMAFDKAISTLVMDLDAIRAEEDEIRQNQEAIIARVEPKIQALTELGEMAHDIVEVNAPRETASEIGA